MPITPEQFIQMVAPAAVNTYEKQKVSAAFTIAQSCLESLYGRAAPGNNLFGIKADESWKGPVTIQTTQEQTPSGKPYTIQAKFRAYPNVGASLSDHIQFLLNNSNYHNIIGADWRTACHEIAAVDHYATDVHYEEKLVWIVEHFGLDKYDQIASHPTKI